ncbi:MAG: thioredoxin-disulfide reductase [Clostridiales bacterium 43-6]|nr:MAG: thioredoxin-disulfide reductase [Clostridiales bacterium 43-6]
MKTFDAIIIGKGPAGISAALYTARANLSTLVIGKNESSLNKAPSIENYYGLSEPLSGEKLLAVGMEQVKALGVTVADEEVLSITKLFEENLFGVTSKENTYQAKTVLIATGKPQKKIKLEGLERLEGRGISYCTTCDGFFFRKAKVGVLGYNEYALHEAEELLTFTEDITIFTGGKEMEASEEETGKFKIIKEPIEALSGTERLEGIKLKNGETIPLQGLFVAYGTASSVDFAQKLGVLVEDGSIKVNADMATNIDGLFAAGDCTGGFKQVSVAVGQGAVAGKSMIDYAKKRG